MKPLRLMMKAIGPYANEQILDFHGFTDKGIFLIHGPTGSGKTTILDAISFALFGVCSNAEIDPKKIRSDHAPDEIPTEVLLDFQIGRDTYRVFRRLEQLKTKKSGQGKTRIPSEATLWRRTGVIDDSSECAAIATQWKRVTEQIESILGLEAQQFSQVVVLPQGQFRKLLVASSKERQQILETLFQTQHYRNIEEALKQKAKEIAEELKQCETVLKSILSRYEASDIVELNNKLESARLERVKTSDEILILREDREKAETVLTEARNQINKLQELLKTQDTLKGLLARQERFTLKRNEVKKARLASQLEEIYRNRELRFDEARKAEKKLIETQAKHQHAIGSVNGSMAILETERQREPERESLRKYLEELENFVSRVQGLDADKKKLERASKKEKEIRTKLNNNENQTLNSEKLLPEKREKAAVLQNTASQIEFLNLKLAQLKKALQDDTEIKKLKELASLATAHLAQNSSEETDCSTQLDNLAEELSIAEEAWLGGQSSLLAQSLAPGKPCPVCGSLDHPSPTRWTQKIPDEARIKKLRKSHDQQRNTLEKIRAAGLEINSRILGFLESIRIRTENLQQMEVDLSRDISQQIKKMAQNVRECNEAARQRELLKQEILELEKRLEEIKQINKILSSELDLAVQEKTSAEAHWRERVNGIPEPLRDKNNLDLEIRTVKQKLSGLKNSWELAQTNLQSSNEKLAYLQGELQTQQDLLEQAKEKAASQNELFEEAMKDNGFVSEDDFKKSRKTTGEINKLELEIKEFDESLVTLQDRVARLQNETRDIEAPDIDGLANRSREVRESLEQALGRDAKLSQSIELLERDLKDCRDESQKHEALSTRYAIVGRIAEIANGQNNEKITFQRFVLASLLDDVLIAASQRLRIMSGQRFSLNRVASGGDKRMAHGLDLEVWDEYTGTARPVSTLSGGESFLASLSLALGLADVVQSYSGGVNLDTIFIDEGFGSLDPEALDLAFQALLDLQASGRLVAIISHVPELRDRIPTRLEVTSGRSGSSAAFVGI